MTQELLWYRCQDVSGRVELSLLTQQHLQAQISNISMVYFLKVLVYLDAHCEVGINWYTPLIAPISKDR